MLFHADPLHLTYLRSSLVPRPSPFLPFVCVHNNTRERNFCRSSDSVYYCERKWEIKTGEGWDRGYLRSYPSPIFNTTSPPTIFLNTQVSLYNLWSRCPCCDRYLGCHGYQPNSWFAIYNMLIFRESVVNLEMVNFQFVHENCKHSIHHF